MVSLALNHLYFARQAMHSENGFELTHIFMNPAAQRVIGRI
jgi:hypothetical protein